jgi:outer membrane lipoprotein SlyB
VDRIEVIRQGDSNNVAGTIIGGIVGGLIGHQIGSGSGNTAATIAGAAGGAYAGNRIQERQRGPNEAFRVTVRMDDGTVRTITQENITDLRTGDRVRVDGNSVYRV